MTNSEILKEAEKLIKACVENFLLQIKKYRNNSRAKNIQKGHLDFSLFYPLNDEYSESKHFERKLAENIREYIVLDVFKGLFELHNIKVNFFNPKSVIGESLTDREERIPYEFIVYDKKCNTGYRLDYPIEQGQNWKIKIFFKLHVIKQIEILVFDKNSQIEFKNSILPETCQKYEKYISVETFFKKYFSIEEYNLYISLGRKAVQQANEEIGLRTIRTMSGYNLSNFKASLLLQYAGIQYQYMKYSFVVNKDKTNELISEDDYAILNKSFITDNLYRAFFGNEDFAKSFITSEYLFNSVGEKELFDYTSVICGYTKSVEQLIYKLLQINLLTLPSSSNLRIRSKNNSLIPFKKENEKSFNTMLNSMINFLQYNKKGWKICCYEHIIDCLSDYKDSCRNEHFHKDNIYDYDTVKRIRNNTT